jgi:hypothetical protein
MVRISGAMTSGAEMGQFKPRKDALDAQSATLCFPVIGSGTMTTATLSPPATNARRFGSPFALFKTGVADEKLLFGNFNSKIRS